MCKGLLLHDTQLMWRLKLQIKQELLKLNHQASLIISVSGLTTSSSPFFAEPLFQIKTGSSIYKVPHN